MLVTFSAAANAQKCGIDSVPARTILIPYFETNFDMCDQTGGLDTVVRLTNISAVNTTAVLRFWTDWGIPVFGYMVNLDGYGTYRVSLREVLCKGSVPDPETTFPLPLTESNLLDYRSRFVGRPSTSDELCYGSDRGNNIGVGYVTIDNEANNDIFGDDDLVYDNVLMGDVFYRGKGSAGDTAIEDIAQLLTLEKCKKKKNQKKRLKCRGKNRLRKDLNSMFTLEAVESSTGFYGVSAVHLESLIEEGPVPGVSQEVLPGVFAVQYDKAEGPFELIVWRDNQGASSPQLCGTTPEHFPLEFTQVVAFDEESQPTEILVNPAPFVTQATTNYLDNVPFSSGWLYFNLHSGNSSPLSQAWIYVRRNGVISSSGVNALFDGCDA